VNLCVSLLTLTSYRLKAQNFATPFIPMLSQFHLHFTGTKFGGIAFGGMAHGGQALNMSGQRHDTVSRSLKLFCMELLHYYPMLPRNGVGSVVFALGYTL